MHPLKRAAAAALVAVTTVGVAVVVAAGSASATVCRGSGNSWGDWGWSYSGATRARTVAYDSTCDGDDVFVGYVRDPYTDGYTAKVYIWDDGTHTGMFHSTGGSSWSKFTFTDTTNDSFWLDGYSSSSHHSYNVNNELELASFGY